MGNINFCIPALDEAREAAKSVSSKESVFVLFSLVFFELTKLFLD